MSKRVIVDLYKDLDMLGQAGEEVVTEVLKIVEKHNFVIEGTPTEMDNVIIAGHLMILSLCGFITAVREEDREVASKLVDFLAVTLDDFKIVKLTLREKK